MSIRDILRFMLGGGTGNYGISISLDKLISNVLEEIEK